jgi:hypothetical protein
MKETRMHTKHHLEICMDTNQLGDQEADESAILK